MIAHKKTAYAYNLNLVKKKQAVSRVSKYIVAVVYSLNKGNLRSTASSPLFQLNQEDNFAANEDSYFTQAIEHSTVHVEKFLRNNPDFAHISFVDTNGGVYTFPEMDTMLMIDSFSEMHEYFSADLLDSSLTRFGSWNVPLHVEPYKGRWVYSCVRAIDFQEEIQGWIVADVNLESLNRVIPEVEKEHCLIMSREGGITFLGNRAAALCSLPKAVPVYSPSNTLNKIDPNRTYSVYNTRDAAIRSAFGNIISENSTREIVSNEHLNIMLVVSPVNETNSLFVRVIEL